MSPGKKVLGLLFILTLSLTSVVNAQNGCTAELQEWKPVGLQQYSGTIHDIAVHPDNSSFLFAATSQHLLETDNCGSSWDTVRVAESGFSNVQFHPTNPDTLIATSTPIHGSFDGGATWSNIDGGIEYGASGSIEDIVVPEQHPNRIYAALSGSDSVNIYSSMDFGTSWKAANDSTNQIEGIDFASISVMDGFDPDRVFVATKDSGAIWESRDVQNHWQVTSLNPDRKQVEYLSEGDFGIWLSMQSGGLVRIAYDHNDALDVDSVQVPDSVNNVRKVVHTRMGVGAGTVLASTDGAYTLRVMIPTGDVEENTAWKNQNEGLPHRNLTDMESGYFDYIFVSLQDSSAGNGVYIRHKPVYTDMKEEKNSNPEQISLGKNYPNPFNPTTKIQFSLPEARQVELSVYNALGQKVATLVNQEINAGAHSVTFDGSGLSSGLYIYKLKTEEYSRSRKMMLVR